MQEDLSPDLLLSERVWESARERLPVVFGVPPTKSTVSSTRASGSGIGFLQNATPEAPASPKLSAGSHCQVFRQASSSSFYASKVDTDQGDARLANMDRLPHRTTKWSVVLGVLTPLLVAMGILVRLSLHSGSPQVVALEELEQDSSMRDDAPPNTGYERPLAALQLHEGAELPPVPLYGCSIVMKMLALHMSEAEIAEALRADPRRFYEVDIECMETNGVDPAIIVVAKERVTRAR